MKSTNKMRKLSPEERLQNKKSSLRYFGEKMIKLADDLQLDGRPLTDEEKELIRSARIHDFNSALKMLKVGYLSGEDSFFNDAMEDLNSLFNE